MPASAVRKGSRFIQLIAFCLSLACALPVPAEARQDPPARIVNHQAKQCGELFRGSVCTTCVPPEGWVVLSESISEPCPQGYEAIEVRPVCHTARTAYCCTEGHSGAPGLCRDLVVNDERKACAFVEDMGKCGSLPAGWRHPEEEVCPFADYRWLEQGVECAARDNSNQR